MYSSSSSAGLALVLDGVGLVSGTRPMLRDCNLRVPAGEVATLIGPNGCGKSTVLSAIAAAGGESVPADHVHVTGRIELPAHSRTVWLPQEVRLEWTGVIGDWLETVTGGAPGLLRRHEEFQARLEQGDDDAVLVQYGDLLAEIERVDAWGFEARRDEVLAGLGCRPAWLRRDVRSLSGGEAARVALAAVLLADADVLLLDEPTNNLDSDGIAFLRGRLRKPRAAVLMVSHDRSFIDATTSIVAAVDEMSQEVAVYGGNYSFYEVRRAEEVAAAERSWETQERTRRRLLRAASDLGERATRFNALSQDDFQRSKSKKAARQSKTLESRINRELNRLTHPEPPRHAKMLSGGGVEGADRIVSLRAVGHSHGAHSVLRDVSADIRGGDRILVRGANGSGKSTLLDIIAGIVDPATGSVIRRPGAKIVHLHQTPDAMPASMSLLDAVGRTVDVPATELRPLLGATIFRDVGRTLVTEVSVGERRRVELAALLATTSDLLLLDEVTNHLDVATIEQLETGLGAYRGALVAVTHDERFAQRLGCTREFAIADGVVTVTERP